MASSRRSVERVLLDLGPEDVLALHFTATIPEQAFLRRKDIRSITLPDSVTEIEERAFCR